MPHAKMPLNSKFAKEFIPKVLPLMKIGLKAIYFNRKNTGVSNNLVPEIKSLDELMEML